MTDAEGETVSLKLEAKTKAGEQVEFSSSGRTITFRGYLQAYVEGSDDAETDATIRSRRSRSSSRATWCRSRRSKPRATPPRRRRASPKPRWSRSSKSSASAARPPTRRSWGRSRRKYVWKKGQALIPNWDAFAVVKLMEKHFEDLVDLKFTAEMEGDLDQIAAGEREKVPYLKEFYFGDKKHRGLKKLVSREPREHRRRCDQLHPHRRGRDSGVVVKPGKYGPYIKRGEDTVSVPDSLPPDEMTLEKAQQLLAAPKGDVPIGMDPATRAATVYVKTGRFGPYVQLGEVTDDSKPKTASIFPTMKPETVTLEQALELLTLPRTLGTADDGEVVLAQNGRYGPYLTKGKESRNLGAGAEEKLLTITLQEALEIFKQPKQFRGRGQAKPATVVGKDPDSGKDLLLKEGRFGWYITDGETNASLRKGDEPGELTVDRALELMAQRREYMASPEGQAKAAQRGAKKAAKTKKKTKAPKAAKASAEVTTPRPSRRRPRPPRRRPRRWSRRRRRRPLPRRRRRRRRLPPRRRQRRRRRRGRTRELGPPRER